MAEARPWNKDHGLGERANYLDQGNAPITIPRDGFLLCYMCGLLNV
jgi:hypothetical protein